MKAEQLGAEERQGSTNPLGSSLHSQVVVVAELAIRGGIDEARGEFVQLAHEEGIGDAELVVDFVRRAQDAIDKQTVVHDEHLAHKRARHRRNVGHQERDQTTGIGGVNENGVTEVDIFRRNRRKVTGFTLLQLLKDLGRTGRSGGAGEHNVFVSERDRRGLARLEVNRLDLADLAVLFREAISEVHLGVHGLVLVINRQHAIPVLDL